jgi:hypothetical protein
VVGRRVLREIFGPGRKKDRQIKLSKELKRYLSSENILFFPPELYVIENKMSGTPSTYKVEETGIQG